MQIIEDVEFWAGVVLPTNYRMFLASRNKDLSRGDVVLLYGLDSIIERNETFETKQYCPNSLTIGDDSGGRQLLLSLATGQISLVDAGSMSPETAEPVAEDFGDWLARGCPLPEESEN